MLALMDEVDHPHVRLNFDTGNIAYYNRRRRPVRRARAGQAPGPERPPEGQPRRLRGLVLPGRGRRRQRRFRPRPRDPRRRRLHRPLHDRDRGHRRRARAGARSPTRAGRPERGAPAMLADISRELGFRPSSLGQKVCPADRSRSFVPGAGCPSDLPYDHRPAIAHPSKFRALSTALPTSGYCMTSQLTLP